MSLGGSARRSKHSSVEATMSATQSTPIAHKEAYELWSRLEAEFERYHSAIGYIPIDQTRIQDDLRRYLCLRCAGFLERLVHECVLRYLEEKSSGPALEFAKSFYRTTPNLNAESFAKLMARFGDDHAARFGVFLTVTLRDSLNDLSAIRNPIAHGDTAGGQKLDPERYRRLCKAVYEWLVGDFLKPVGVSVVS